ncbi:hypothetical protein ABZ901_33430 [Actinacidiphila alni]|uniref:hypothetical protein n=1 Tax=Actinacidiphila alni TaxID=380248 RepID=UPI0033E23289
MIPSAGTDDNPHAHLDAVVAAEVGWGNRIERDWYVIDWHFGYWDLVLAKPFHIAELRETFAFPESVVLTATVPRPGQKPSLFLGDSRFVSITSPLPKDWPYGEGEVGL